MLFSFLVDSKKKKAQKQAIKSGCLLLRNRDISKQPILTRCLQSLIRQTFDPDQENIALTAVNARQIALLGFLAAAL